MNAIKEMKQGGVRALLNNFIYNTKLLFRCRDKDVVISFAGKILDFYALFKTVHLVSKRTRIICIIHHYSPMELLSKGFDRILFLSPVVFEIYKKKFPKLSDRMSVIEWGPDISYYDSYSKKSYVQEECILFSNGKTNRDNDVGIEACRELDIRFYYVTDSGIECSASNHSFSAIQENTVTDNKITEFMVNAGAGIIPIKQEKPGKRSVVICGLTSVWDALALGKPVIISDNSNLGIDFEQEGIGLEYKAGDRESFKRAVLRFQKDRDFLQQYGRNARLYAEKHSYRHYCDQLAAEIERKDEIG